jgi:hypothetical protein
VTNGEYIPAAAKVGDGGQYGAGGGAGQQPNGLAESNNTEAQS